MKLTTPLKIFLSVALLAGGAQAASLSLGPGGLNSTAANPAGTLFYTDPSGIVIKYFGQSQSNFGIAAGTRGWNNDANPGVNGFSEVGVNHLAIAHFGNSTATTTESIELNFSGSAINLSTVRLKVYDLDTNGGFQEQLAISNGNGTLLGGAAVAGAGTNDIALAIPADGIVTLTPNQNPSGSAGLSAFTLEWTAIPEPSTGLLALLGSSVLFFRRRR
jgi:hypothetical protein